MAEKGILVADHPNGVCVATRDAYDTDDLSNARVIPRIMPAGLHIPASVTVMRTGVTAADAADLTSIPAAISNGLIVCGDKTQLHVVVEYTDAGYQNFYISPIIFDNESPMNIVGVLTNTSITADTNKIFRTTGGAGILSHVVTWNLCGAHKVGVLVTFVNLTSSASVKGWVT